MNRVALALATALLTSLLSAPPAWAEWAWPLRGEVITPYRNGDDPYASGQHRGIDIAGEVGASVVAAAGGEVRFAGTAGSSGLTVSVRTADGRYDTSYLHLSSTSVREGDRVGPGERLGTVGTTGTRSALAPHLHFGVRDAGSRHAYHDPLGFLPPPPAGPAPREAPAPEGAPVPVAPAPAPVQAPAGRRVPVGAPAPRAVPVAAPNPRRVPVGEPDPRRIPARAPDARPVPVGAPGTRRGPARAPGARPVRVGAPDARRVPVGARRAAPGGQASAVRPASVEEPAERSPQRPAEGALDAVREGLHPTGISTDRPATGGTAGAAGRAGRPDPDIGLLVACLGLVAAAILLGLTEEGRKTTRRTRARLVRLVEPVLGRR